MATDARRLPPDWPKTGRNTDARSCTAAGIAVHPHRADLRARLPSAGIGLPGIDALLRGHVRAIGGRNPAAGTGRPIIGVVECRDGRVIDVIRRV